MFWNIYFPTRSHLIYHCTNPKSLEGFKPTWNKDIQSINLVLHIIAGSTALGFYTPMKGTAMDNLFQLGVTRYALPESSSSGSSNGSHSPGSNGSSPAGAAGSRLMINGNGSIMGIGEGLIKEGDLAATEAGPGTADGAGASKKGSAVDEDDYHLTATPGAEVVYSEGTQKTDLLY